MLDSGRCGLTLRMQLGQAEVVGRSRVRAAGEWEATVALAQGVDARTAVASHAIVCAGNRVRLLWPTMPCCPAAMAHEEVVEVDS